MDWLILAMIWLCEGVVRIQAYVWHCQVRKTCKACTGSFSLEFSYIEAFYYTTPSIHMALLACRLKRNLLAGVYSEVLMLL
jgi:hypothetical protein